MKFELLTDFLNSVLDDSQYHISLTRHQIPVTNAPQLHLWLENRVGNQRE